MKIVKFLIKNKNKKEWHISYNGLAFDAQVTHYIMDNYQVWKNISGCAIGEAIYAFAQKTIERQNNREFGVYAPWHMKIGQIDLFKMHHWDNPAKRSSLKWIQYSMDWENMQDGGKYARWGERCKIGKIYRWKKDVFLLTSSDWGFLNIRLIIP